MSFPVAEVSYRSPDIALATQLPPPPGFASLGYAPLCAWRDGRDSFTFCSAVACGSVSLPTGAGVSAPGLPTYAGQPETLGGFVSARAQELPRGLTGTILSALEGDLCLFIRNHSWCQ